VTLIIRQETQCSRSFLKTIKNAKLVCQLPFSCHHLQVRLAHQLICTAAQKQQIVAEEHPPSSQHTQFYEKKLNFTLIIFSADKWQTSLLEGNGEQLQRKQPRLIF
jgi:hypothetical protein